MNTPEPSPAIATPSETPPAKPMTQARAQVLAAVGLWSLQGIGAAVFIAAGVAKLIGAGPMIDVFDQIGAGQWLRYLTGAVEVTAGIALLVPAAAVFGGLALAITMVCAVLIHVFVVGGSSVPALILFAITAAVAWFRRASFNPLLRRRGWGSAEKSSSNADRLD